MIVARQLHFICGRIVGDFVDVECVNPLSSAIQWVEAEETRIEADHTHHPESLRAVLRILERLGVHRHDPRSLAVRPGGAEWQTSIVCAKNNVSLLRTKLSAEVQTQNANTVRI